MDFSKFWQQTTDNINNTKDSLIESQTKITEQIREWIVSLFTQAIASFSDEQDRLDTISWLALIREIIDNPAYSLTQKTQKIYSSIDSKKTIKAIFNSVTIAVDNYNNSDLPLPMKIAIPATLTAATIVGGQGVGIAAFGTAIGMPVLLLIFLGTAGITSVIETFLGSAEAKNYLSIVMALITQDEILRRVKKDLHDAMKSEPLAPNFQVMPKDEAELREKLLTMNPYEFEQHIMGFFQNQGMLAWVTKKSNDAGVDGFARHPQGLIIVQCKRYSIDNSVGRPTIQQFKGVIEENEAWRGYIVTTSQFTKEAIDSASKNSKLHLIDMEKLVKWHLDKFTV